MNAASKRALIASVFLLPAAGLSTLAMNQAFHHLVVIGPDTLPATIDGMSSTSVPLTQAELSILDSPAASQRLYTDPATGDQSQVLLLQVDNTQNAHDPRLCMTGSGYKVVDDRAVAPPWNSPLPGMVSRAVFRKDSNDVVMYYWLQTDSRLIPDLSAGFKIHGILQALRGESVKGVAVRLILIQGSAGSNPDKVLPALWNKIEATTKLDGLIKKLQ